MSSEGEKSRKYSCRRIELCIQRSASGLNLRFWITDTVSRAGTVSTEIKEIFLLGNSTYLH